MVFDNDRYVGRSLIELGEFCEEQAVFFTSLLKPDAIVVEVGANIGAHTVVLAKKAAYVYAFEPQRRVYNVLCGNMALNELDNVECHRIAGGERRGIVNMMVLDFSVDNNFGAMSLDNKAPEGAADPTPVEPITIPCDLMKIDVEGWEMQVLRGAEPMIRHCKPVLYVENDRKDRSNDLISLIRSFGYKAYWHKTRLFNPENFHGVKTDPFDGACSHDMLCLPADVQFDVFPEAQLMPVLEAA